MTGGGAVFHDLGNVNFTHIFTFSGTHEMDFAPFAAMLTGALARLGVPARFSGRNDIVAGESKISGCAHACAGNRALYHGTLLFSADLTQMESLLRFSEEKYRGRGIRSVAQRVVNISSFLPGLSAEDFMLQMAELLSAGCRRRAFTPEEAAAINTLAEKKRSERL
jgi:lipoate-protein ligase A